MPDQSDSSPPATKNKSINSARRNLLLLIPYGILAGMAATVATAAFRFLRPFSAAVKDAKWTDVAPVAELRGEQPIMRTIVAEHEEGWSIALEEHMVYILPEQNNRVVSSMCPHENCDVAWREDTKQFFCPCHDSYFAADGGRVSGPARRGLDPLPSRVKDGVLQVQYQSFVNNTEERVVRG